MNEPKTAISEDVQRVLDILNMTELMKLKKTSMTE